MPKVAKPPITVGIRWVSLSVRTKPLNTMLDLAFVPGHPFKSSGATIWLKAGGVEIVGGGGRLTRPLGEALVEALRGPLDRYTGEALRLAADIDWRIERTGVMAPVRELLIPSDAAQMPYLEIGGVGASTARFWYQDRKRLELTPPRRPSHDPATDMHPSTAAAIRRWEATWSDGPAGRLRAAALAPAHAALVELETLARRLLPAVVLVPTG